MKTEHIEVVDYDSKWVNDFNQIKGEIEEALKDLVLAVEHVGSTSVPLLAAKPIIDLDVVIDQNDLKEVIYLLENHGYIYEGDLGLKDREAFRYEGKEHLRIHHLYVCPQDSKELKRHLAFSNYLRKHPNTVKEYGKIKKEAAKLYPNDIEKIVSEEGFGINDYIETTKPLVVVTAPGPGSGKMATCLSQLYHEYTHGIKAGYAKFETFPIWNIPLKHPVNLAYEAATADLNDVNMIDPFHLEAYNETTVNYNRDVEIFPVLESTFKKIMSTCPYKSPTDMGVNMAGNAIIDDEACKEASKQEIIRRYYQTKLDFKRGLVDKSAISKIEAIMLTLDLKAIDRKCVNHALEIEEKTNEPGFAIELNDGHIITGKTTSLLGSASACLLNALKYLANIDDDILLIEPEVIEPVAKLKKGILKNKNPRLHTDEILLSLAISANNNENAKKALSCIEQLQYCEAHSSVILSETDIDTLKRLGIRLTSEDKFQFNRIYQK